MGVFINCTVEMGLDAMICIPSFMKTGSGIQKLIRGGGYTRRKVISYAYFYFFKLRKVGYKIKTTVPCHINNKK
jgi:hypothetical protein